MFRIEGIGGSWVSNKTICILVCFHQSQWDESACREMLGHNGYEAGTGISRLERAGERAWGTSHRKEFHICEDSQHC